MSCIDPREAFTEALLQVNTWRNGAPEPTVELHDQQVPVRQIFTRLLDCPDVLSGMWFDVLGDVLNWDEDRMPKCCTVGAASRPLTAALAAR